jgi:hypothetical protein
MAFEKISSSIWFMEGSIHGLYNKDWDHYLQSLQALCWRQMPAGNKAQGRRI